MALDKDVKEIVELFHKRDQGINKYDETYELWLSQLDYLPHCIPDLKEPFQIETEVIAVEPDLTSPKYKELGPIGTPRSDYIRVAFVKGTAPNCAKIYAKGCGTKLSKVAR